MSAVAADYRLRPAEIRADWCQARRLGDVNKDTRWSPAVYREVQCEKPPASASGLCAQCQRNMENYTGIKSHWTGRITEEPFKYQHMLGTEWAVSNIASGKLVWNGGPAPAWWRPDAPTGEAESLRISDRATAEANIGGVCTYDTKDGREYGRILRVTATEIVLERLHRTDTGVFVPHPVTECPRSRNRVTYQTRDVRLVSPPPVAEEAPAPFAFNVPEEAPAPVVDPRIAALEARNAALEAQLAAALALIRTLAPTA
jgi:hypothetical protein